MSTEPERMKPIEDFAGQQLKWSRSEEIKQRYELRAGAELLATLDFERRTLADAEFDAGRWTFKREGFWHPQVTIREAGAESNVAVFRPHLGGGGELTAADGHVCLLKSANFWSTEWIWESQGEPAITYKRGSGMKPNASVDVAPGAVPPAELPLLVLLGWYLILLFAQDAAIQGATAASSARIVVMHP